MLLDRKRINRWAKWVALGLAIVFGASFVFMGVGTGIDIDWGSLFTGSGSSKATSPSGPQERIAAYDATLATDPSNMDALLGAAADYSSLGQPLKAAEYLEKAAVAAPDNIDIWMRLADIYMSSDGRDYAAAVRVLNQATLLDSNNAQAFLQLGAAERGAGNVSAAILSWNRYLQLEPTGDMADTVRSELSALSPPTTSGATPTTDAGSSTTMGATTSTT